MPKVMVQASKGLFQKSGSGFPYLDFVAGYEGNLTASTTEITAAESEAAEVGDTPNAAAILAATAEADSVVTSVHVGAGTGTIHLPAANAGTHVVVKMKTTPSGTDSLVFQASHATYAAASELARVAAGGTAAVFGVGPCLNGLLSGHSDGADTKMTVACHGTNCSYDATTRFHFFCVEDGVWLAAVHGKQKGSGLSNITFS